MFWPLQKFGIFGIFADLADYAEKCWCHQKNNDVMMGINVVAIFSGDDGVYPCTMSVPR